LEFINSSTWLTLQAVSNCLFKISASLARNTGQALATSTLLACGGAFFTISRFFTQISFLEFFCPDYASLMQKEDMSNILTQKIGGICLFGSMKFGSLFFSSNSRWLLFRHMLGGA